MKSKVSRLWMKSSAPQCQKCKYLYRVILKTVLNLTFLQDCTWISESQQTSEAARSFFPPLLALLRRAHIHTRTPKTKSKSSNRCLQHAIKKWHLRNAWRQVNIQFGLQYHQTHRAVRTLGQIPSPFWKPGASRPTSSKLQMMLELMQTGSFLFTVSRSVRLSSPSSCSEKAVLSLYLTGSPGWVLISHTSHSRMPDSCLCCGFTIQGSCQ